MLKLTNEEKELIAHIKSITPDDGHLVYDFKDPKQYRYAHLMANLSGAVSKYPGRIKTLENIKEIHVQNGGPETKTQDDNAWQDMYKIDGLNLSAQNGKIAATGFATIAGGFKTMDLDIVVQSLKTGDFIASGTKTVFTDTIANVETEPSNSAEIDVDSVMQYTYYPNGDGSPVSGHVLTTTSGNSTADPTVTAPVRTTSKPKNAKAINIGLGRHWTDQGGESPFDYAWYEEVPAQDKTPQGKIPFVGHVKFAYPINHPLEINTNLLLDIFLTDETSGGGHKLDAKSVADVAKHFFIDSHDNTILRWSLKPGKNTKDEGNPIDFENVPWGSDTLANFYCYMTVSLNNPSVQIPTHGSAKVISSKFPDSNPIDGITYIKPIDFIWHCLANDTVITMSDKKLVPIISIVAGDKVASSNGAEDPVVEWTNLGDHRGDMFEIVTDSKKSIVTSDNHIFFTDISPLPASELKVGDRLKMEEVDEKIISIEKVNYEGLVCNLATQQYQEPDNPNAKIGTFIANGFVVGDINAQRVVKQSQRNTIRWVMDQVPEHLHEDVEVYFAEK